MFKSWIAFLLGAPAVVACGGEPFGGITGTISAEIETADTTIFPNDAIVVRAVAQYTFGPGSPQTISWAVSDTSKLAAFILGDLAASVSAKDTGTAWVIARINDDFRDSMQITVVDDGLVRWRVSLAGAPALLPAIADDSSAVVVSGSGRARGFSPLGTERFSVSVCSGSLGPTLPPGKVVTTGDGCTARTDPAAGTDWSLPIGDTASGAALAADGSVIVLHETGQPADVVVLSRISSTGVEAWRDTLRNEALAQASAPAIASNGDIYVPWRAPADSSWLTRVAADGTVRWTVPMPGWSRYASPAIAGTRIVVGHEGGVTVFDTAGAVVWSRAFTADLPGAAVDAQAASPIIDGAGNIFVQSEAGLVSYLPGGTTQWAADSLGYGSTTGGVGGPVLLLDGTMVVPCMSATVREVCGVRQVTGDLVWRSAAGGGSAQGLVVGNEGSILVTWAGGGGGELVALWGRSRVDPVGWPVGGRTTARTRRAN